IPATSGHLNRGNLPFSEQSREAGISRKPVAKMLFLIRDWDLGLSRPSAAHASSLSRSLSRCRQNRQTPGGVRHGGRHLRDNFPLSFFRLDKGVASIHKNRPYVLSDRTHRE